MAKKKPARKPLSASTKKTLAAKAKKSGISQKKLETVYRRGQGAYLSAGSRNTSMAAAMGRVNSFIGGSRKHDTDLEGKNLVPKRKSKKGKKRKVKYEKGVPSKYLSGSRNKKTKAAEIKRTSNAYKDGRYIDLKKVQKSRVNQGKKEEKVINVYAGNPNWAGDD